MTSVPDDREAQLREACRDLTLDEREERIIRWLASMCDAPTRKTITSLLEKVREAGYLAGLEAHQRAADRQTQPATHQSEQGFLGNTGPGW